MRQLDLKTLFSAQQAAGGLTSATQNMSKVEGYSIQYNLASGASAAFDIAIEGSNNGTDWTSVDTSSFSGTTATKLLIENSVPYLFMRTSVTNTATGVQIVTTVADVAASLNNTYFLLNAPSSGVQYYVWFNVDSTGTDPMIAGKTGVEVDISAGDTADTVATAVASAVDALAAFASSATGPVVTVTNAAAGNFTPASDGAVPTGFSFAITTGKGLVTVLYNSFGEKATQA